MVSDTAQQGVYHTENTFTLLSKQVGGPTKQMLQKEAASIYRVG